MRLVLRRGVVADAGPAPDHGEQRLVVRVDGRDRPAVADVALVGPAQAGDDVVVNAQAVDLALGSGGSDIVHVNLTRGLDGTGVPGAHVMKLNYSSLQHAVAPVEERPDADGPATGGDDIRPRAVASEAMRAEVPVGVFGLHGQLAPIAWAIGHGRRPGAQGRPRVGYVQTAGGALPGGHSRVVGDLIDRGLLCGHLTAGPTYGGRDGEAITTVGAIDHAVGALGWDVVLCGPGPGILGSGSRFGHGGMVALDTAHAALALGQPVVLCARMSSGDPRERHRGLSHHTQTVLDLLLAGVDVALPRHGGEDELSRRRRHADRRSRHTVVEIDVDLDGYAASGLPARTMGRTLDEDPLFFAAALACGARLSEPGRTSAA